MKEVKDMKLEDLTHGYVVILGGVIYGWYATENEMNNRLFLLEQGLKNFNY